MTNPLFENVEKTIDRIKNDTDDRYDDVLDKCPCCGETGGRHSDDACGPQKDPTCVLCGYGEEHEH